MNYSNHTTHVGRVIDFFETTLGETGMVIKTESGNIFKGKQWRFCRNTIKSGETVYFEIDRGAACNVRVNK